MIPEIDVTVYQITRHANEYTLPHQSHTTRNHRPAALPERVVLTGGGSRTFPIIQRPSPVESTWQEGSQKVRVNPALLDVCVTSIN
ncbi:MAG: hypothetical protein WCH04_04410 [Gammaproteobacteria bacterium]